jgi:hypothetical protein
MQPMSAMPINLLSIALESRQLSSQLKTGERWPTFEEILQSLHKQGIYIHSEQLAEFLLAHGLPVHLRYVPAHLRRKAIQINQNYNGDMVRVIEELDPPYWDFSWMEDIQKPSTQDNETNPVNWIEEIEQPTWDYSWIK